MNFQNLEYFLVVADEGNVTRAAEKLHLSQQALSVQMKRLEEELGSVLFLRRPAFRLTYAGECFREEARKMLNLKHQSETMLEDIRGDMRGRLRIGVSYSRGRAILPIVLPEFTKAYPLVDLSIVEDNPSAFETMLLQGELDVILNFLPFESPKIRELPLFKERIFTVIPKALLRRLYGDLSDSVAEEFRETGDLRLLSALPFILLRKGEHIRAAADRKFSADEVVPEIRIETSNTQTAIALASQGMGAAVVHEIFLQTISSLNAEQRDSLYIIPIKGVEPDTIGIGFPAEGYIPKATRDFITLCEKRLREFTYKG